VVDEGRALLWVPSHDTTVEFRLSTAASRMESTGISGKIQVSTATAAILKAQGKEHWLEERTDSVCAKGKGVLHTFWANPSSRSNGSHGSCCSSNTSISSLHHPSQEQFRPVNQRLVDWMVDLFADHIKKVVSKAPPVVARSARVLMKN
jgi:Adenylate and Guanylate cyclase catalytic domain